SSGIRSGLGWSPGFWTVWETGIAPAKEAVARLPGGGSVEIGSAVASPEGDAVSGTGLAIGSEGGVGPGRPLAVSLVPALAKVLAEGDILYLSLSLHVVCWEPPIIFCRPLG